MRPMAPEGIVLAPIKVNLQRMKASAELMEPFTASRDFLNRWRANPQKLTAPQKWIFLEVAHDRRGTSTLPRLLGSLREAITSTARILEISQPTYRFG